MSDANARTSSKPLSEGSDIRDQLRVIGDDVKDLARAVTNSAGEGLGAARDKALAYRDQLGDLTRDNPMRALLIAASVGAVLGLILGRR